MRLTALAILCGVLTSCSSGVNVLMDQKQASAAGVPLEGPIAMDGSGNVYLVSKGLVWRYNVSKGAFQQQTQKPSKWLVDLAVGDDNVVLALDKGRVLALASGSLVYVVAIPGQPYKLSVAPDCLYVATRRQGKYQVLRYRLSARRLEPVLQSQSPITAICGLAEGVLVAFGESIYKVSAPLPGTQPASAEVSTAFVCAIYGAEIKSIAADPQRRIFYFSDGGATFFWADGQVRELLPTGGMLAVRNDRLVMCSPVQGQLVEIRHASQEARRVVKCIQKAGRAASPSTQPPTQPSTQPAKVLTLDLGNNVTMKLVLIPSGKFMMGSPKDEKERDDNEGPRRKLTISKAFYVGVYEVTQEQYEQVMGSNLSRFRRAQNPVETVSWHEAAEFCKKLSQKTGKTVQLPTEAQWEYACRAGTTTPFNTGKTISTDEANYDGSYAYGNGQKGKYRQTTIAVGSFKPNDFGLYDMHGNVWEWCADWYADSYVSANKTDPSGPASGSCRVLRGGSWLVSPGSCRSAVRYWGNPGHRFDSYGFRVAVVVIGVD